MKLEEFFQDVNGFFSMGRLLLFGSFIISSAIMIMLAYSSKMTEGYMTIYIATFAGTFAYSKQADKSIPQPDMSR